MNNINPHKYKRSPSVSILIPLYNAENYIEATIQSCLSQTYSNIEVIIVDDGSTDNSFSIAKKYENDKVKVYQQSNQGGCVARNYAFSLSKGEYIQYLDADDLLSPDKIEEQMKLFAAYNCNPEIISFSTPYIIQKEIILEWNKIKEISHDYDQPVQLLIDLWKHKIFLPPHSYLFHRELQNRIEGWNIHLSKNQDGEFYARIIKEAYKIIYCEKGKVFYRKVSNSISQTINFHSLKSQLISWEIISKILLNFKSDDEVKKAIISIYCDFLYNYYPVNKIFIPKVIEIIQTYQLSFQFSNNDKLFYLLQKRIGWKLALMIIKSKTIGYTRKLIQIFTKYFNK